MYLFENKVSVSFYFFKIDSTCLLPCLGCILFSEKEEAQKQNYEENALCTTGGKPGLSFPCFEETQCFWRAEQPERVVAVAPCPAWLLIANMWTT